MQPICWRHIFHTGISSAVDFHVKTSVVFEDDEVHILFSFFCCSDLGFDLVNNFTASAQGYAGIDENTTECHHCFDRWSRCCLEWNGKLNGIGWTEFWRLPIQPNHVRRLSLFFFPLDTNATYTKSTRGHRSYVYQCGWYILNLYYCIGDDSLRVKFKAFYAQKITNSTFFSLKNDTNLERSVLVTCLTWMSIFLEEYHSIWSKYNFFL